MYNFKKRTVLLNTLSFNYCSLGLVTDLFEKITLFKTISANFKPTCKTQPGWFTNSPFDTTIA